jgi:hypothetical protein
MDTGIGRSLGTSYFRFADQLTGDEPRYLRCTRDLVDSEVLDSEVLPVINSYWERAEFPWPLIKKLAKLSIVGDGIDRYGCPPMSPIAAGLVNMELNLALETSARRDGGEWVIDGQDKGLLVEKGTPGYDARPIDGQGSLRAVWRAEITLSGVRVTEENPLPGATSFKEAGRPGRDTQRGGVGGAGPRHRRLRGRRSLLLTRLGSAPQPRGSRPV